MQKFSPIPEFTQVTPTAEIRTSAHGWRAKCLQRLIRLDLPVPKTVALPAQTVRAVLPYGGPSQQAGYRPDGGAHWMSARGIVACSKDGEITNLQDKHIAIEVSGAAATLTREADGTRAIVAALTEQGSFAAGIGTWAQARIIRKGQT